MIPRLFSLQLREGVKVKKIIKSGGGSTSRPLASFKCNFCNAISRHSSPSEHPHNQIIRLVALSLVKIPEKTVRTTELVHIAYTNMSLRDNEMFLWELFCPNYSSWLGMLYSIQPNAVSSNILQVWNCKIWKMTQLKCSKL